MSVETTASNACRLAYQAAGRWRDLRPFHRAGEARPAEEPDFHAGQVRRGLEGQLDDHADGGEPGALEGLRRDPGLAIVRGTSSTAVTASGPAGTEPQPSDVAALRQGDVGAVEPGAFRAEELDNTAPALPHLRAHRRLVRGEAERFLELSRLHHTRRPRDPLEEHQRALAAQPVPELLHLGEEALALGAGAAVLAASRLELLQQLALARATGSAASPPRPARTCRRARRCAARRSPCRAGGTGRRPGCRAGSSPWPGRHRSPAPRPAPPSAACVMRSGTRTKMFAPSRWKIGCGRIADIDVEVARRRAAQPGLALAGQPDAGAVLDAGGDGHVQGAVALHAAGALADLAGVLMIAAGAAAGRAGALDQEEALLRPHLAGALQVAQVCAAARPALRRRCRCRPRRRREVGTRMVFLVPAKASSSLDLDAWCAGRRRGRAPGAAAAAPAAAEAAEHLLEDVLEAAAEGVAAAAARRPPPPPCSKAAWPKRS